MVADPPPIMIVASGTEAASLAGDISDGLISTTPKRELIEAFKASGGEGLPCIGQVSVCWAEEEDQARRIAHQ